MSTPKRLRRDATCTRTAAAAAARKMLNKEERSAVVVNIKSNPDILDKVTKTFQNHAQECLIFGKLLDNEETLTALIEFHRNTFVRLYEASSKGKDKYISFQIQWYKHCSILLLPKHLPIQCIFSPPTKDMDTIRQLWLNFCCTLESNDDNLKKFMISFSSAVYNTLMHGVQVNITEFTKPTGTSATPLFSDQDDVYFRFGGATIASMLHHRYNEIRTCSMEKKDNISLEIKLLQTINTKDKVYMPDYLQYRDKGHMYSPDPSFIPFFRAADECVKSIVNEKGIGDQLTCIKVCCTCVHYSLPNY